LTNVSPDPVYQPPSFIVTTATSLARQGLTAAAGVLAAHSLLPQDQTSQFVQVGIAIALSALSLGWSILEKKLHQKDAAAQVVSAVAVTKAAS
jgi:hypothetical protein